MKYLAVVAIFLTSCCTCPPKTGVTPTPNVVPVKESNSRLKSKVKVIQDSNQESIKANTAIGKDIDSADEQLKKLIGQ